MLRSTRRTPLVSLNRIVTIMVRRPERLKEHRILTRRMNGERASFFTRTELRRGERLKCSMLLNRGITIEFDGQIDRLEEKEEMFVGEISLTIEPIDFNHLLGFLAQIKK